MTSSFRFEVGSIEGYSRRLRQIRDRASNDRTMFQALAERFKNSERRIFATEGQALGRRWAALNPEYATVKERQYPGQPILVRTGKLRTSLTERPAIRFRGNTMEIGTNVEYSKWLQEGVAQHNLPPRPHVGLTFGDRQAWVNDVRRYIVDGRPMGPR